MKQFNPFDEVSCMFGAYWGLPANVWGVWGRADGEVFCVYVRANSRKAAIEKVRQGDI